VVKKLSVLVKNQQGVANVAILAIAIIGVLAFISLSSIVPFKNQLFSSLFPKPSSHAANSFLETFDGVPASPQPFENSGSDANWDISSSENGHFVTPTLIHAHHGSDCLAPIDSVGNLITHDVTTFEDGIFRCNGHIMTALNGPGYSLAYLTPNQIADFSTGEVVIRFDMATLRTSPRDWVDVWITPYEDNLVFPLEDWLPIQNGYPKRAVHVRMDNTNCCTVGGSTFRFSTVNNFIDTAVDTCWWCSVEDHMTTSPKQRSTFELRLSRTHVKFSMPGGQFDVNGSPINNSQELVWVDKDIPDLGWSSGVIQFGHHSYNPTKDCTIDPNKPPGYTCTPNTWHWDNVSISNAVPITNIKANRRYVSTADNTQSLPVVFNQPAPANAYLRFAGIGVIEYSLNNGSTWLPAKRQLASREAVKGGHAPEHDSAYFISIPQGTQQVNFRFSPDGWYNGCCGAFIAQDFAIWSTSAPRSTPVPTPTPTPTNIPTPTPAITPTPTSSPTQSPTPLPSATSLPLSFTTSATASPATVSAGSSETMTVSVKANQNTTALVDVEVYDSVGTKVLQTFYDNQAFTANLAKTYTPSWAIPANQAPGVYTVKIGIFGVGFNGLLSWNDGAATFTVTSTVPTPTPAVSVTPTPGSKPGDIDGNGKVDIFDYNILLGNFGKSGSGLQGDLDGNNKVDIFDYNILLANFGK
jgi:hypothetical protein